MKTRNTETIRNTPFEELDQVGKTIKNELFIIGQLEKAVILVEPIGYVIESILKKEIANRNLYVDGLISGRFDWINEK